MTLFSPSGFPHWCCNHHLHPHFFFSPLQGLKLGSQRAVRRERHTSAMAAWRRNTAAQDALKETIAKVWTIAKVSVWNDELPCLPPLLSVPCLSPHSGCSTLVSPS